MTTDAEPATPREHGRGWFRTKFPAKAFDAQGRHVGPGPWLDLIHEAGAAHPGFFGEPVSLGPWWAGGTVEQYPHARVIHHLDESVSVVALDEVGDRVLTQADNTLRARHNNQALQPSAHPTDDDNEEKGGQP